MTQVLRDSDREIFEIVNFVFICCVVGIFGIVANIINMIIFYKQGFKTTVNIGFFSLAVSDLMCLLTLQWASVSLNPLFASAGIPWSFLEVYYLTGAWPHVCFSRITAYITVYITAERYLSIALPLKVKHIITSKTVTAILCLIYLVNIMGLSPEYTTSYLGWRFVPKRNATLLGIVYTNSRSTVEGVSYALHSIFGITSFAGVIIFTALLVTKLGQTSKWRKTVMSTSGDHESMSNRDMKTVKMVILIASVLIACYTPGAVIALTTFIVGPEFDVRGKYVNICEAAWSIAYTFQSINSSVNIFLYYSMSSKYKQTFNEIIFKQNPTKVK